MEETVEGHLRMECQQLVRQLEKGVEEYVGRLREEGEEAKRELWQLVSAE